MLLNQLLSALIFYGVTVLFSAVGLPFTLKIFSNTSLAYVAARFVGLLLFGYLIWLLASLHILDYQWVWVIWLLLIACVTGSAIYTYRSSEILKNRSLLSWSWVLAIEIAGLSVYLVYLYLRAHNAEINGTEKFMDMALMSASGKTNYFPFVDPWYAGKSVNYYYFGVYLASLISNLTHVPYALTYNFSLGFIYTQASLLAFALIYYIGKSRIWALFGAVFLTSAGTVFFANCVLQSWLRGLPVCSYASSTRLFSPSYIINEIPSYSFTVGDLHAHLLALPVFLLGLSLLYAVWASEKLHLSLVSILVLTLACIGLINPWDLITLSCLLGLLVMFKLGLLAKARDWSLAKDWLAALCVIVLGSVLLMWPGTHGFQNPVMGLGFAPGFVRLHALSNVQWPTPFTAEVGMWGIFFLFSIYFFTNRLIWQKVESRYLFILALLSVSIIVGVELFFVRDIYSVANPPYFRANTTFKFGYHAWTMLTIVTFAGFGIAFSRYKGLAKCIFLSFITIILISGAVYPVVAVRQFYLNTTAGLTLDGSLWMRNTYPEDWAVIGYINNNIHERSVIAEAVGDSYTTFSRISTYTGQITPMGWQTHEWTWRFHPTVPGGVGGETGWTAVNLVAGDIKALYETSNIDLARQIIAKYGIKYVYVGALEQKTYAALDQVKFSILGDVVFKYGNSYLYQIDDK